MGETKTFVFGNEGAAASNNLLASILPSLQQRGIDTGYLLGMLGNNNRGGIFGDGNGIGDIIALVIVAALFGNGNGGIFGNNGNNNSTEREMLLSAIQRNGVDLSQLASTLNCSVGRLDDAIGQVATQICNLTGQVGMNSMQIINAVQAGNTAITSQICNCCCEIKGAIKDVAIGQERGFASVAYETQRQTCDIEKAINGSTSQITARLDAMEKAGLYDKIDALREKNGTLTTQLNLEHQNNYTAGVVAQSIAPVNAALADLSKRLADIECNQPPVAKIPYVPAAGNYIPVSYSVPMHFGANYGNCGYNYGC